MTAFADILAAASIYAEMTGCDQDIALQDMDYRASAVRAGNGRVPFAALILPAPELEPIVPPPAPAQPVQAPLPLELTPWDNRRFMQALIAARPGAEYSPGDLALELNMAMPKTGSKRPSHLMRRAGWVFAGFRSLTTNRGQVYRKPLPHEVAA